MTEKKMTGLLLQLADLGVTGIKVHYDGGGDSGAIENIVYTKEKLSNDEEAFETISELDTWGEDILNLNNLDSGLYSLIKDFAQDKLLNDIEDWWNNEGGHGDLCICVPSGKYTIYNQIYVTHTEDYTHKGDLLNKTEEYD
jgi:hypothetical protein